MQLVASVVLQVQQSGQTSSICRCGRPSSLANSTHVSCEKSSQRKHFTRLCISTNDEPFTLSLELCLHVTANIQLKLLFFSINIFDRVLNVGRILILCTCLAQLSDTSFSEALERIWLVTSVSV